MFLLTLCKALEEKKIPYAIAGGFAVALHGVVRGTIDVDLVIQLDRKTFIDVENVLMSLGLAGRLPVKAPQVFDFREDYIRNKNLIAWSFYDPNNPMNVVDIIITENLKKHSRVRVTIKGQTIYILSKKSLITMKKNHNAHRILKTLRRLSRWGNHEKKRYSIHAARKNRRGPYNDT